MSNKILLATHNSGKLAEFQQLLSNTSFSLAAQSDYSFEAAQENGLTFVENALIKARHAAFITGLPTIADDSGLVVKQLNGLPGIYSARYAGEQATDAQNRAKLLQQLAAIPNTQRQAAFYCVLVFIRHWQDPVPIITQGIWQGEIAENERGTHGFGYDALFYLPFYQKTAAELEPTEKNTISHRAQAMTQLLQQLES